MLHPTNCAAAPASGDRRSSRHFCEPKPTPARGLRNLPEVARPTLWLKLQIRPPGAPARRTFGKGPLHSICPILSNDPESSRTVPDHVVGARTTTLSWRLASSTRPFLRPRVPPLELMWSNKGGKSEGLLPGREALGPLALIGATIPGVILIWHTNFSLDGSFIGLAQELGSDPLGWWGKHWPSCWDPEAWGLILGFMAWQLMLMRVVPGKPFRAHLTPAGNVPVYTANGMQCFIVTLLAFVLGAKYGVFQPSRVYDKFGEILSSLNVFSLIFCFLLMFKGYFAPSSADSGTNNNWVLDYFWGVELYPRVLGWDIKTFTNCRFGMMYWAVGILCYAAKQIDDIGYLSDSMFVCVSLQLIYIAKFFWWESGYWCSMDIQHDRAGYYLCWGCLVYLPCMYTSQAYYLAKHPVELGAPLATSIFIAGFLCIWANYDADRQRQQFRLVNGDCLIWGSKPRMVVAEYTTENGITKRSLLLASGWWGQARHFHYVFEIGAAFFWSVPGLFNRFMPFLYVTYLTILLLDRAYRDDARCRAKYKSYWEEYCAIVPYKVVPGVI